MLCSERSWVSVTSTRAASSPSMPTRRLGADLVTHLGLDDHVLEVEITPNRPDCLSVVGVARELSALTGAPFRAPVIAVKESDEAVSAWRPCASTRPISARASRRA